MNQEALQQRIAARREQQAQQAKQAQERLFSTALQGVNTDAGPTYEPQVRQNIQKFYQDSQRIMGDKSRPVGERLSEIAQNRALLENSNKAGVKADTHLRDTFTKFSSDSRYDRPKLLSAMHQAQYGPDGSTLPAEQYNPRAVEEKIDNVENYNLGEVYKRFAKDAIQRDAEAYERAARPGGTGLKTYFEGSQLIERDPVTHLPVLDKTTGEPVLRVTPGTVLAAKNDPFVSRHLDSLRTQREAMEQGVVQKMQNNIPLDENEQNYLEQRQRGSLPTIEQDLAEQLVPYAYSRTRQQETYRAAPRPVRAAAGSKPKYSVSGGSAEPEFGRLGLSTQQSMAGFLNGNATIGGVPTYFGEAPRRVSETTGKIEPLQMKGTGFTDIFVQEPGQNATRFKGNFNRQDMQYERLTMQLVDGSGNLVVPPTEAESSDPDRYKQFVREYRAKHPNTRFVPYVEATTAKGENETPVSVEQKVQQIKDAWAGVDPQLMAAQGKRLPTPEEMRAQAEKAVRQSGATFLLKYQGPDRIKIDTDTQYAYKKQTKFFKRLEELNESTKPGTAGPAAPSTGGLYTRKEAPAPVQKKVIAPPTSKPIKANAGLY